MNDNLRLNALIHAFKSNINFPLLMLIDFAVHSIDSTVRAHTD